MTIEDEREERGGGEGGGGPEKTQDASMVCNTSSCRQTLPHNRYTNVPCALREALSLKVTPHGPAIQSKASSWKDHPSV